VVVVVVVCVCVCVCVWCNHQVGTLGKMHSAVFSKKDRVAEVLLKECARLKVDVKRCRAFTVDGDADELVGKVGGCGRGSDEATSRVE
jgi:hypothetical protein